MAKTILSSNSDGNHKSDASTKIERAEKTVRGDSMNGKSNGQAATEKSASESDQLTLRAWKKTFENRKKAA